MNTDLVPILVPLGGGALLCILTYRLVCRKLRKFYESVDGRIRALESGAIAPQQPTNVSNQYSAPLISQTPHYYSPSI